MMTGRPITIGEDVYKRQAELLAAKDALSAAEIQKYMELVLQAAEAADTADASKEALEAFHTAVEELRGLLEDSNAKTHVKAAKAIGVIRAMGGLNPDTVNAEGPVSYTHLDVYKRQIIRWPVIRGVDAGNR